MPKTKPKTVRLPSLTFQEAVAMRYFLNAAIQDPDEPADVLEAGNAAFAKLDDALKKAGGFDAEGFLAWPFAESEGW